MPATETPATLTELIDARRDADRPVTVHVEIGRRGAEMTIVEAVAQALAERIAGDDGAVVEDVEVGKGDVWLGHRWSAREEQDVPVGVRSRAEYHAGVVLVAPEFAVPSPAQKTLDARVRVVDDRIDATHAVRYEPYEDRTYYKEIAHGLPVSKWWDCPSCGGETAISDDPPPHRSCAECEWSVTIPEVTDGPP
jgi:hypothetical protein